MTIIYLQELIGLMIDTNESMVTFPGVFKTPHPTLPPEPSPHPLAFSTAQQWGTLLKRRNWHYETLQLWRLIRLIFKPTKANGSKCQSCVIVAIFSTVIYYLSLISSLACLCVKVQLHCFCQVQATKVQLKMSGGGAAVGVGGVGGGGSCVRGDKFYDAVKILIATNREQ